jgi:hypothetical protein
LGQKGPIRPLLDQNKALGGSGGLFCGKKEPRRPLFALKWALGGLTLMVGSGECLSGVAGQLLADLGG